MLGNNKNWEELYQQAVQELDFQKIVATRDAIAGRLRDLENNSDHHSERHRIEDALLALTMLESDIKKGQATTAASCVEYILPTGDYTNYRSETLPNPSVQSVEARVIRLVTDNYGLSNAKLVSRSQDSAVDEKSRVPERFSCVRSVSVHRKFVRDCQPQAGV